MSNLPDESVNCVVTSPPYFGLRDYGVDGQIGLEATPQEFIQNLVKVFSEVWRVLKKDGTVWLNFGDSYYGSGKGSGGYGPPASALQNTNMGANYLHGNKAVKWPESKVFKPKDLMFIPHRVAMALQEWGWYVRSDVVEEVELFCPCGCGYIMEERIWRHAHDREIIWKKPNAMPESVTDRPTRSHEYFYPLKIVEVLLL